jgi:hypothetical protein
MIQKSIPKINGGSWKRNCKRFRPRKIAEMTGYLNTNCHAKSGLNSFSFASLRFKVCRKILSAIISSRLNIISHYYYRHSNSGQADFFASSN